jgi:hypothetical protein
VVLRPDGSEKCAPFAATGVVIPTSDGFWLADEGRAVRVETDWCAMHGAVTLPASAVPVGTQEDQLLVDTGGATSEVDGSNGRVVPLAIGRLESATGAYAVVRQCDATARCPMVLLGPGASRPLLDGAAALDTHAVVAPDGGHVALLRGAPPADDGSGGWSLAVLDVSTGLEVSLADRIGGTAEAVAAGGFGAVVQWSPDGRWLVYATPDGLTAWRPGTSVPLEITGGHAVAGFVLAPANGGAA